MVGSRTSGMNRRSGVFVTGTDTGVGKTVVAACLVRRWSAEYWKPAQTGLDAEVGDSSIVAQLAGAAERIHPPRYALAAALSPEAAAARQGVAIKLSDFELPDGDGPIVVEGAGGVLVPLCEGATMADLMLRLGLPALLVVRATLGTINHSLLSLEALRSRDIPILGAVVVGTDRDSNAASIGRLGRVDVLATIPRMDVLTRDSVAEAARALPARPPTLPRSSGLA